MQPMEIERALCEARACKDDAERARAAAMADIAMLIIEAKHAGIPVATVARWAGLSRKTVYANH